MQTIEILQFVEDNDTFLITYYAKKHGEIITRRGTWTKPNTDTKGKHFETKGNDVLPLLRSEEHTSELQSQR